MEPSFKRVPAQRGECFYTAFRFATENPEWDIVHGIPLGQGEIEGVRFGHGWNEITHNGFRWAYDAAADILVPAQIYYLIGHINYIVTYPFPKAVGLAVDSGHAGPWDDQIFNAESL